MSINGWSIYVDCWLMLEPIGWMIKTLNRTMCEKREHLKIVLYLVVFYTLDLNECHFYFCIIEHTWKNQKIISLATKRAFKWIQKWSSTYYTLTNNYSLFNILPKNYIPGEFMLKIFWYNFVLKFSRSADKKAPEVKAEIRQSLISQFSLKCATQSLKYSRHPKAEPCPAFGFDLMPVPIIG
jgi:hypothetical protein